MMVTPLETIELLTYLSRSQMLTNELKEKCEETVERYRLNSVLGNGKKSFIRRTYTCPFFGHQELGCPLPREIKPYGCLAFNSHHAELKAGEHCHSETELLEKRETSYADENDLNEKLKTKYKLYWEKLPLPVALLETWNLELSDDNLG